MSAQAKIINMLLYDGSLGGVIRIEDSNWNAGELFSAPRESVSEMIDTGACNRYGVYLLLSANKVYVGQSSDLAKRISQHIAGKDWWESVIILTTKDDTLNRSDIDYLEYVLIEKANAIQNLDSDNKKSGNPPKVDIFKKTLLNQYLEEALFLMQLIGIRVFAPVKTDRKARRTKKKSEPALSIINQESPSIQENPDSEKQHNGKVPPLPDTSMKVGQFIYAALRNLGESGYSFTDSQIDEMCTSEWSKKTFHTKYPFMKRYLSDDTDNRGTDGEARFIAKPFAFGDKKVLISKEWYERQRPHFIVWYNSLK